MPGAGHLAAGIELALADGCMQSAVELGTGTGLLALALMMALFSLAAGAVVLVGAVIMALVIVPPLASLLLRQRRIARSWTAVFGLLAEAEAAVAR